MDLSTSSICLATSLARAAYMPILGIFSATMYLELMSLIQADQEIRGMAIMVLQLLQCDCSFCSGHPYILMNKDPVGEY